MVQTVNFPDIALQVIQIGVNHQPLGILRRMQHQAPIGEKDGNDDQHGARCKE